MKRMKWFVICGVCVLVAIAGIAYPDAMFRLGNWVYPCDSDMNYNVNGPHTVMRQPSGGLIIASDAVSGASDNFALSVRAAGNTLMKVHPGGVDFGSGALGVPGSLRINEDWSPHADVFSVGSSGPGTLIQADADTNRVGIGLGSGMTKPFDVGVESRFRSDINVDAGISILQPDAGAGAGPFSFRIGYADLLPVTNDMSIASYPNLNAATIAGIQPGDASEEISFALRVPSALNGCSVVVDRLTIDYGGYETDVITQIDVLRYHYGAENVVSSHTDDLAGPPGETSHQLLASDFTVELGYEYQIRVTCADNGGLLLYGFDCEYHTE